MLTIIRAQKSEPLFSIVMPVYNVAPYLPACLDSLIALDPPPDEIVVVDDGSTDDCPRILAGYPVSDSFSLENPHPSSGSYLVGQAKP
jgi:glycosyltransferase involved in cell wall biosynthesis